jgi:hypothetical protein
MIRLPKEQQNGIGIVYVVLGIAVLAIILVALPTLLDKRKK